MPRILILGTGLIGSSLGLALKAAGQPNEVLGYDRDPAELATAVRLGAIDRAVPERAITTPGLADIYVLATPVLPILDWLKRLAPALTPAQLVTDVGSTKREIAALAAPLYNGPGQATFLPGHPMAGKESGGAALADANLFRGATWLFTPLASPPPMPGAPSVRAFADGWETTNSKPAAPGASPRNTLGAPSMPLHLGHGWDTSEFDSATEPPPTHPLELLWRSLVASTGAHIHDLDAAKHDEFCAWVSHLPQYLSTALAALLEDTFAADPAQMAAVQAIGGRALRETTRLGASPYSMWRDIALTNTENVAATLLALEQRLQHLRENLRTPELREEFATANKFRASKPWSDSP